MYICRTILPYDLQSILLANFTKYQLYKTPYSSSKSTRADLPFATWRYPGSTSWRGWLGKIRKTFQCVVTPVESLVLIPLLRSKVLYMTTARDAILSHKPYINLTITLPPTMVPPASGLNLDIEALSGICGLVSPNPSQLPQDFHQRTLRLRLRAFLMRSQVRFHSLLDRRLHAPNPRKPPASLCKWTFPPLHHRLATGRHLQHPRRRAARRPPHHDHPSRLLYTRRPRPAGSMFLLPRLDTQRSPHRRSY